MLYTLISVTLLASAVLFLRLWRLAAGPGSYPRHALVALLAFLDALFWVTR